MPILAVRAWTVASAQSKGGVLETNAMTVIDESAVRNAFCNVGSRVAEHIQMIGRSKSRKPP
jgi:hypothetical protein